MSSDFEMSAKVGGIICGRNFLKQAVFESYCNVQEKKVQSASLFLENYIVLGQWISLSFLDRNS